MLTLNPHLLPIHLCLQLLIVHLQLIQLEVTLLLPASLTCYHHLQVRVPLRLHVVLVLEHHVLLLHISHLLPHVRDVVLQLLYLPMQLALVLLHSVTQIALVLHLHHHRVALSTHFVHSFVGHLDLVREVVDMSLQCMDLCDVVLFFLLHVPHTQRESLVVLIGLLQLRVQLSVLFRELVDASLQAFVVNTRVSVVMKNIFLLHFKSFKSLLSVSFTSGKFFVLLSEELVGLASLAELLINELVFSSQSLDIFCEFTSFLLSDDTMLSVLFCLGTN